jgi:hypothetical protein
MTKKATEDRGAEEAGTGVAGQEDDVFDKGFDAAITEGEGADREAANEPEEALEPEPEPKKVDPPAKQPDETDEKYEQRYKTLQGILKHEKEEWEKDKAALLSQLDEAKKSKVPEPAPKPEAKDKDDAADFLTDEEKKQLEEYEKDFATVTQMEGLKRKGELAKISKTLNDFIADVTKRLSEHGEKLGPVVLKVEKDEATHHFGSIKEAHEDYEKYRDDGSIVKWIEAQPKYLQPAMKETYEKGTAEDVIQLIADFKKANNINHEAESNKPDSAAAQKKEKKRQALAAVDTRRGAVNSSQTIADDFESAFDEALTK